LGQSPRTSYFRVLTLSVDDTETFLAEVARAIAVLTLRGRS